MPTDVPALPAIGPRFEVPASVPAPIGALRAQLRRAVRSLIGQRGGVMLLHAWGSGASMRIECGVQGAAAELRIACDDECAAAQVRSLAEVIGTECSRHGCKPARIECLGPALSLQPAA